MCERTCQQVHMPSEFPRSCRKECDAWYFLSVGGQAHQSHKTLIGNLPSRDAGKLGRRAQPAEASLSTMPAWGQRRYFFQPHSSRTTCTFCLTFVQQDLCSASFLYKTEYFSLTSLQRISSRTFARPIKHAKAAGEGAHRSSCG